MRFENAQLKKTVTKRIEVKAGQPQVFGITFGDEAQGDTATQE